MLTRRLGTVLLVAPFALVAFFASPPEECSRERPKFRTTRAVPPRVSTGNVERGRRSPVKTVQA